MWRSFFFAVGIGLMVLGAEALVFERIVINRSAKLPKFLNGLYEKGISDSFALSDSTQIQPFSAQVQPPNKSGFPFGSQSSAAGSQFGPSRFSGPQYGNYGGGRVDLSRSGLTTNRNQTAGPTAYPVSFGSPSAEAISGGTTGPRYVPRTIVTKDWMPWSLLAAGAIIFLYTSSQDHSARE